MTIAYITHPACRLHQMGDMHPESPSRLSVIEDRLIETGFEFALRRYDSPAATREQLLRVHEPSYVERIFALAPARDLVWIDPDTAMNPHSLEAALHAAGAVVQAVDLVLAAFAWKLAAWNGWTLVDADNRLVARKGLRLELETSGAGTR